MFLRLVRVQKVIEMRSHNFRKIGAGLAVAGGGAVVAYVWGIRPWHLSWGATDDELSQSLPGDELTPHPRLKATHAITINAPAADVWPWLVQMGQTRGGFYSYTWLENLVGCKMRNADEIVPEWQQLKVGDSVWLHPKAPPTQVAAIEPGRAIVLKGWGAFVLQPIDDNTTRLIIRSQGDYEPNLGNAVLNFLLWRVVFEPAHFIMERKMLLGIKARAEKLARERGEEKMRAIPEYSGW
jgi:hypothetical protein